MVDSLVSLDSEQQYAVDFEGSMLVVAGPGSGKTRMLTEKARRVFETGESILCLAFTRSAAREMASRVVGLPCTTIHSYCCGRVGWKESWGYTGLLHRFLMQKDIEKFSTVLVDEVQDLNSIEMDVVLSMVGDKLFAVGDPYQSIYGFQGAMGLEVLSLLRTRGCKEFRLHNNYRSCPEIVERLNKVYRRGLVSRGIKDTGLSCILCRTNEDVFYVSSYLKGKDIPHRLRLAEGVGDTREKDVLAESKLRLMTIHQAKGMEFNSVQLFGWRPNEAGEETRVYYVGMSRASETFTEVRSLKELKI